MKRFILLFLAMVMILPLSACGGADLYTDYWMLSDGSQNSENDHLLNQAISDGAAFQFTKEGDIRMHIGSSVYEGKAIITDLGKGKYLYDSDFQYLNGKLNFDIKKDTMTVYRDYETPEEGQTFIRVEKPDYELKPSSFRQVDDNLTGYWYSDIYLDSYEFFEDGTAVYNIDQSMVYGYKFTVDYVYSTQDGVLNLSYHDGTAVTQYPEQYYTISDDILYIGENMYYRTEK